MPKGFGLKPIYKLVITTAIGGATDLVIPAASNKIALRLAGTILNILVNPDADIYQNKALKLGLEDSLDVLKELSMQMAGDSILAEMHPDFAAKIAKRAALTKVGDRSVLVVGRAKTILPMIKPKHFMATLYAPNGRGIMQYSNLLELDKFEDWGKVP